MKTLAILLMAATLSACSVLPNVGPSKTDIRRTSIENGGNTPIIPVTYAVAAASRPKSNFGFPSSFFGSGLQNYEGIKAGDVIEITVWENTDNGLFATLGARVTKLSPMRVNEKGTIFVPYVGELRAAGRTTDQLRSDITAKLAPQTPDPQIEVAMTKPSTKGGVMIFGGGSGGLVPFTEGNLRLASMLATAGMGASDPRSTRLTVTRGGDSGTILLQSLYDNSKYDIPLRSNDRIVVENDRRFYRILGAGGAQALVPFARSEVSVLDAISESGGLNGNAADPSGIFIFRKVSAEEANRYVGQRRFTRAVNVVFTVNLRGPDALFTAQEFQLQDGDTIYITEAPYVTWTKVITSLTGAVSSATSLTSAATSVGL